MQSQDILLSIENISRHFHGLKAVNNVSVTIKKGEIIGLIGPNGAGKTTLINVITGLLPPTDGALIYKGANINKVPAYKRARMGIARTFQVVQPFTEFTVYANTLAAATFGNHKIAPDEAHQIVGEVLETTGLADRNADIANSLTIAMRKRLEFAKVLAMKPNILFLDEVNAGLNESEMNQTIKMIKDIADSGITIVLVEHLMKVVMSISQRILVLDGGQLIADGSPAEVISDPAVVKAYVGTKYAERMAARKKNQ